eukprot:TRINITY_DN24269_c0_g1_i1.p1 TRINITY_DN24269_c0_g1~~TRINITY_DN24269_c0_g1_i1.p1  ORF type:complete len:924 (-),score=145.03 TRINITY_DN24269_c0_g1_i1:159-2930(-)
MVLFTETRISSMLILQVFMFFFILAFFFLRVRIRRALHFLSKRILAGVMFVFAGIVIIIMYILHKSDPEANEDSLWFTPAIPPVFGSYFVYRVASAYFPKLTSRITGRALVDDIPLVFCTKEILDEEPETENPPPLEIFPPYWTNTKQEVPSIFDQMVCVEESSCACFDDMVSATYKQIVSRDRPCPHPEPRTCPSTPGGCPCVQVGGDPGMPTGLVVRRVVRVEDATLWQNYVNKREQIRAARESEVLRAATPPVFTTAVVGKQNNILLDLDESVNEVYLWHGTFVRHALSIAQDDFRLDLAGTNVGTMYGKGIYLAECSSKADEYARDEPRGYYEGTYAMLLCRACLGKMFYTTRRDEEAGSKVMSGEFDSTLGDRAQSVHTYREFVLYDVDQVYPEYIVIYNRIHAHDNEVALRALACARKFQMELPVYWRNCHMNPSRDTFAAQYRVRKSTRDLVERLAQGSAVTTGPNLKAVEVRRVEDSEMWTRYIDFKRHLRKRLTKHPLLPGCTTQSFDFAMSESSGNSDEYSSFAESPPLLDTGVISQVEFSCIWQDQGFGTKGGRIMVLLVRDDEVVQQRDLFGVCRANGQIGMQPADRLLDADDPIVTKARAGDVLRLMCLVGVGKELHVEKGNVTVYYNPRAIGISRYDDAYFCAVTRVDVIAGKVLVHFVSHGDGSQGDIQDPAESTLTWEEGEGEDVQVKCDKSACNMDRSTQVKGFVSWSNVPTNGKLLFTFGSGGYSSVDISGSLSYQSSCTPVNELDGNPCAGHTLTEKLLEELHNEDAMSIENLAIDSNEMLLWHGTSQASTEAIADSGFVIQNKDDCTHGRRFGNGAYFAEDLDKSLSYCTTGSNGIYYVLLCRVTCGEMYYTEDDWRSEADTHARNEGKDSVLANPKGIGPREFIALEEAQVYPEFVVLLATV